MDTMNKKRRVAASVDEQSPDRHERSASQSTWRVACAVAGLVVGNTVWAVALATPPSGIVSAPILARASFQTPVDVKFKVQDGRRQEVLNVHGARDTVVQQIIIGPGGTTGWHSHPGPVVVLVKSGTLTLTSSHDCVTHDFTGGDAGGMPEAFIDSGQGHVHIAHNLSETDNVELWATYFDVPPGEPFRIDSENIGGCSF